MQSNYSYTGTLHGGPVVIRPVRATPCYSIASIILSYYIIVLFHVLLNIGVVLSCVLR